ncbi:MAG: hypothetical protein ACFE85_15520 [Candidatus Hodarchaeota archaeon]
MDTVRNYIKINYPILLILGAILSGITLIIFSSLSLILIMESTPPDRLLYLISAKLNDPFEWVYKSIIWGNILIICGLIFFFYIVLLKRRKEIK